MATASDLAAQVRALISDPVATTGATLEDVEVRVAGRRRLVRVSVDTDTGIDLDDVAAVTRVVSAALDDSDVLGDQPYVLEVGSPGVSRPLTEPRHWRRNVGRLVRVVRRDGGEPIEGRVAAPGPDDDAGEVTLLTAGAPVTIALSDVKRAVVQVELNRGSSDGH